MSTTTVIPIESMNAEIHIQGKRMRGKDYIEIMVYNLYPDEIMRPAPGHLWLPLEAGADLAKAIKAKVLMLEGIEELLPLKNGCTIEPQSISKGLT